MSKKDKVTETSEQEKTIVTRYDRRLQKKKEQEEKIKRDQKITLGISLAILVAVVALILSFPIRTYIGLNQTYVEIGGDKITKVEFDYYYNLSINKFYDQYSYFLPYLNVDFSQDLSLQMYSDTLSWKDYFEQLAVEMIRYNKAMIKESKAAGFSYDTTAEYEKYVSAVKENAKEAGVSTDAFVKNMYGSYATLGRTEPFVKEGFYADAYYEQVKMEKMPSEDEVMAYYEENTDKYDSVDYRLKEIKAELPTEPTELADPQTEESEEDTDGSEEEYKPSEAEIAAAMEIAKADAEEAALTIEEESITENRTSSVIDSLYRTWLFDAERKEGDVEIFEDTAFNRYFVIQFVRRYRDDTLTANARVIISDETQGETILAEWSKGAATEESFIELVHKYSKDSYAVDGLYEGLIQSAITETEMADWLFEEGRKTGDTTALTLSDGNYFTVYYIGQGKPSWFYDIRNSLLNDIMAEYRKEVTVGVEVVDIKGNLHYLTVPAEESTEPTEEDSDPTEEASE